MKGLYNETGMSDEMDEDQGEQERASRMAAFMNNYYDALDEMEEDYENAKVER